MLLSKRGGQIFFLLATVTLTLLQSGLVFGTPEDQTCEVAREVTEETLADQDLSLYMQPLPGEVRIGIDQYQYSVEAYGIAQQIAGEKSPLTRRRIAEMEEYMQQHVLNNETLGEAVIEECKLRHELCAFWAIKGECERNPSYMTLNCAPVCRTCDKLRFDLRCPFDHMTARDSNIWKPGDLNRMFERIVTDPAYAMYEPKILSQPTPSNDAPWVVVLDNFLTDEECDSLIRLGGERGYERSTGTGPVKFDGSFERRLEETRTSTNAWCLNECYEHPLTKSVLKRIESVTGIPDENAQYLQMLKYEVGQFYRVHHDYIPHEKDRRQGPRILTVFLYLNDVEAGGGTNFPRLDLTVTPKRGRALLWPAVHDSDPTMRDDRTEHQALTVEAGVKFGANAWLHLRDFKSPFADNCI